MTLPNVVITMITYNRPKPFAKVMESIYDNIVYPKDKITLIIADDKSDTDYVSDWAGFYADTIIIKQPERSGMPHQWNDVLREAPKYGDYIMPLMDDWLFTEPVDLRLGVLFMQCNPIIGFLRYHKLAGHVGLPSVVRQWDSKEGLTTYVDSHHDYDPSLLTYLELLPPFDGSNTYSPYSGGVHLRHRNFTGFFGEYTEGLKFSNAEMDYFERVNKGLRENLNVCPRFAIFPHYIQSRFRDISEYSYRDTIVEAETVK